MCVGNELMKAFLAYIFTTSCHNRNTSTAIDILREQGGEVGEHHSLMFIKPSVKDQTKALLSAALEISRLDTSKMFEAKSSIQLSQQVEHILLTKERERDT